LTSLSGRKDIDPSTAVMALNSCLAP